MKAPHPIIYQHKSPGKSSTTPKSIAPGSHILYQAQAQAQAEAQVQANTFNTLHLHLHPHKRPRQQPQDSTQHYPHNSGVSSPAPSVVLISCDPPRSPFDRGDISRCLCAGSAGVEGDNRPCRICRCNTCWWGDTFRAVRNRGKYWRCF